MLINRRCCAELEHIDLTRFKCPDTIYLISNFCGLPNFEGVVAQVEPYRNCALSVCFCRGCNTRQQRYEASND